MIVGVFNHAGKLRRLFSIAEDGKPVVKAAENINAYLVAADNVEINSCRTPVSKIETMTYGNKPVDGGNLLITRTEIPSDLPKYCESFIRPIAGSHDYINGRHRYCIWIRDDDLPIASKVSYFADRIEKNRKNRLSSRDKGAQKLAMRAHQFRDLEEAKRWSFIIPRHSSETRPYLPVGLLSKDFIINDSAFALYDAPLWNMALIVSCIHLVWIATVCGKLKTDFRYSNTLGWNTFPVSTLTKKNKADLTTTAENILLAREAHFPATIAELYKPDAMPQNLRAAHAHNDEVLERIYIGRRFKNDTERLEKLFEMYTKMTTRPNAGDSDID